MKGFKKRDVLNAIKNSDFTYTSVAKYLAALSPDGKCSDKTAKEYIEKYGEETEAAFRGGIIALRDMAIENVKKALRRGDVRTSKWLLERIERGLFSEQATEASPENTGDRMIQFVIVDSQTQ